MIRQIDRDRVAWALATAEERLLASFDDAGGHWRGELSASALSTATASFALIEIDRQRRTSGAGLSDPLRVLTDRGLAWLTQHANDDGGWGDTIRSQSNLSTTLLCWAALSAGAESPGRVGLAPAITRARQWIVARTGSLDPGALKTAVEASYGEDRTFSIPILTLCALAGVLGPRAEAFRGITRLPFELAALPQSWFRFVGLPVVSYALPALIAVGQVQHRHHPPAFPPLRGLRTGARRPTLRRLQAIQPTTGGYLEAIPLTSFVAMSLAGAGEADHPVVDQSLAFLEGSVLDDGSWPIDVDLATWVTTLSVQAFSAGGDAVTSPLDVARRTQIRAWLLGQQYGQVHPYTGAAPGGWAWTDLPGGVPDADDTAGALLALHTLDVAEGRPTAESTEAAQAGIGWLLDLQNRDGGIPTFCRGWGKLPFDRSASDLTAHALRAFLAWRVKMPRGLQRRIDRSTSRMLRYLRANQRPDGAWLPLWFGNEAASRFENPTYGTARTLRALEVVSGDSAVDEARARGVRWLLGAQNPDGGWGGDRDVPPSLEETALAVDVLVGSPRVEGLSDAVRQGCSYLTRAIEEGALDRPSPIGFYFANLWYFEAAYPMVFAISALRRAMRHANDSTRVELR